MESGVEEGFEDVRAERTGGLDELSAVSHEVLEVRTHTPAIARTNAVTLKVMTIVKNFLSTPQSQPNVFGETDEPPHL